MVDFFFLTEFNGLNNRLTKATLSQKLIKQHQQTIKLPVWLHWRSGRVAAQSKWLMDLADLEPYLKQFDARRWGRDLKSMCQKNVSRSMTTSVFRHTNSISLFQVLTNQIPKRCTMPSFYTAAMAAVVLPKRKTSTMQPKSELLTDWSVYASIELCVANLTSCF